ncbi:MAG TPA: 2Fe-2S iron-sulfur cluster-binding protein [Vicinamibacterales bacterium]|nr:2Fe-2S iron-sulfur cluster-binding protein [Vicinamibacterales bacterium]
MTHALHEHLATFDAAAWRRAVEALAPSIHEIDRTATRIWFHFFPLDLFRRLEDAPDEDAMVRKLGLMGNWRLREQVDVSHRFLFAHRYWPQVKTAIQAAEPPFPDDLAALITDVAHVATRRARCDREMLLSITAVGLMTLRQAGPEAFWEAPGHVHLSARAHARSPHQILARRAKDDWQGPLGFLRGLHKRWTVTFDENDPDATFPVITGQELATAAQTDKRDYRSRDIRCIPNEGPIPVECRAASCGTCWVGVLGGAAKLSPVVDRDERRRMQVFGYVDTDDPKPEIRLACQARASGAVSIVIPPWNGIVGKLL